MRIVVAIAAAECLQVLRQQAEMQSLLAGHAQPVAIVGRWQPGEAPGRVQRQVDGVELDVGDGMQQGRAAGRRERRAPRESQVLDQPRALGPPGQGCDGRLDRFLCVEGGAGGHRLGQRPSSHGLLGRVLQAQHLEGNAAGVHP